MRVSVIIPGREGDTAEGLSPVSANVGGSRPCGSYESVLGSLSDGSPPSSSTLFLTSPLLYSRLLSKEGELVLEGCLSLFSLLNSLATDKI